MASHKKVTKNNFQIYNIFNWFIIVKNKIGFKIFYYYSPIRRNRFDYRLGMSIPDKLNLKMKTGMWKTLPILYSIEDMMKIPSLTVKAVTR